MKLKILILSLLLFTVLSIGSLKAQPGDPGGDPDQPVPLTGIEWLLLAGAGLGAGKLISKRNSKT